MYPLLVVAVVDVGVPGGGVDVASAVDEGVSCGQGDVDACSVGGDDPVGLAVLAVGGQGEGDGSGVGSYDVVVHLA